MWCSATRRTIESYCTAKDKSRTTDLTQLRLNWFRDGGCIEGYGGIVDSDLLVSLVHTDGHVWFIDQNIELLSLR